MSDTIRDTLYATIGTEPTAWEKLVAAVEEKHTIRRNGWMRVRGELQGLINAGLVARVNDVHAEDYIRVTG